MPIFTGKPRFVNPNAILSQVNDVLCGGAQTGVAGVQIARCPGQLGGFYYLTALEAAERFAGLTQPLYEGLYQYVQAYSGGGNLVAGQAVVWGDATSAFHAMQNYTVNATITATSRSFFAGVALNAVTAGNFGWIQVAGLATVKYVTPFTGISAAIGVVIVEEPSNSGTFDTAVDAANTTTLLKTHVGTAAILPVAGSTGQVLLYGTKLNY